MQDGVSVLVLCLGNDIRGDDGVGWEVASALEVNPGPAPDVGSTRSSDAAGRHPRVVIRRSALSGFYLLDELAGYDRAIVVDAVQTGAHLPGTVLSFPFEALGTEAGPSPHAVGLPSVVRLGRRSGVPLPTRIHIVAIEVDDIESVVEGLTPAVRDAVPRAAGMVRSVLADMDGAHRPAASTGN